MKFATKAIHAGQQADPATGAIMTPIYQTSTYVQEAPGKHKGYEYSRTGNPTRRALEHNIAALESANYGLCFGSGLAAIDAVLKTLRPGDEVVSGNDIYGGTYRLFTQVFSHYGIVFRFVDMQDHDAVRNAINGHTKLLWVETPTNPMLQIIDIRQIAMIAREAGAMLCVDNTFASPALQRPLELGADVVMHSATKYLGGHSDVVMGALAIKDAELAAKLAFIQNASGAVCGPMDAFLVLRGTKTLHLRMKAHCENAEKVARFLGSHASVGSVRWPGLPGHPGHELAKSQMDGFGGMVTFTLKDDRQEAAIKVLSGTHLFSLAESLGGVESLIGHPASMTHASIPRQERWKVGLMDSTIRLSVGIEDADDLIEDLAKALDRK
ncbi:MAG: cystathionine gamma-synthase [Bacteroidetes bacterium]|jgi:cystathionine beta-lyase|nr:cystathionine gamma-synthase [Bacteroidota bacterium]